MIKKNKNLLVIGFSNQIIEIIAYCQKKGIDLNIIAGKRQKNSNKIEIDLYKTLKNMNFSNIEFLSSLKNSKKYKKIINNKIDKIISLGSPFIFTNKIISLYKNKLFNSHGSPLPEYRGGGGLTWRYLNADIRGSVIYHEIDEKLDTGKIIYRHNFTFPINKPIKEWIKIQIHEEKKGIRKFLDLIYSKKKLKGVKQPNKFPSYFPRINTTLNSFINFNWHGHYINRFINGFSEPYEGAQSFINKQNVKIMKSRFIKKKFDIHPFTYGIIFDKSDQYFFVFVPEGYLKIEINNLISKNKISIGDRIHTPFKYLDKSFSSRVFYNAVGLK